MTTLGHDDDLRAYAVEWNRKRKTKHTKSLGNGRCTDEKRNQRLDDILVGHLISFFYNRNYQIHIVFYNKPSQDLDVKKCD